VESLGICILAPIITHRPGGLQRQIYLQTRELSLQGHKIFAVQKSDPTLESTQKRKKWSHVEFKCTPSLYGLKYSPNWLIRFSGALYILFGLYHVFKNKRFIDIIYAHQLYSPTLLAAICKYLFRIPFVVRVAASGGQGEKKTLSTLPFPKTRKWAFKRIDRVIALSKEMHDECMDIGFAESRISIVPNSVEIGDSCHSLPVGITKKCQILFTGRLSQEKNLETMIKSLSLIKDKGCENFELHICGEKSSERDSSKTLIELVQDLGLSNFVIFHGRVENIEPFYRKADVFVLPSLSEGMSNSLLEAMSFGLCCVVSDIKVNSEMIQNNQNGILFQTTNVLQLANILESLIENRIHHKGERLKRLGSAAFSSIQSKHSTQFVAHRLIHIYSEVLGGIVR